MDTPSEYHMKTQCISIISATAYRSERVKFGGGNGRYDWLPSIIPNTCYIKNALTLNQQQQSLRAINKNQHVCPSSSAGLLIGQGLKICYQ